MNINPTEWYSIQNIADNKWIAGLWYAWVYWLVIDRRQPYNKKVRTDENRLHATIIKNPRWICRIKVLGQSIINYLTN